MIGSSIRRALTVIALIAGAAMLQGCAYDPYTGTYNPCCAYPAYSYSYPAYSYPAYGYPAYSGGVVVSGGYGEGYSHGAYWGGNYRGNGGGGGSH
jgi:hypothetical protein